MAEGTVPLIREADQPAEATRRGGAAWRLIRYTGLRLVALFLTVVVGVYIAILIANMGGYVDQIRLSEIQYQASLMVTEDMRRTMTPAERAAFVEQTVQLEVQRLGMDRPFILRSFSYLGDALTLNLGFAERMVSDSGSRAVQNIILERLPATLVLFGTANLLLFFISIVLALGLSRSYGSWVDKLMIALAPTSAAPGWFYGIFLILVFAAVFRLLPFGGMVAAPPPEDTLSYALSLARHMILPVAAILVSGVFFNIYRWRTFFLIYSSEDYVEMARAKGLPDKMIERRYVLRPTLPTIITDFSLLAITLWSGAIILETVFNWPGLGRLYFSAIGQFDTPVIVANVVIYAYLLGVTVFLLDFIYALVDPRVRVGDTGRKA
jgi:peptide/nickel transport system permease protein